MNKKLEWKRFLIYIGFTFGITWAWFAIMFLLVTKGAKWEDLSQGQTLIIAGLGMFGPILGALCTRWVTKEGFAFTGADSMFLGISFKDKKWIWFLVAVILPWIYFELGYAFLYLLCPDAFDIHAMASYELADNRILFLVPLNAMINGAIGSIAAFGEEAGWRGYMIPKMIKVMGVKKALIFGGIIWGAWHWPITAIGHDFGCDYWGYPYLGMICMCVYTIGIGTILTILTIKSKSIWPAAIMHAVNNASPSVLQFFLNTEADSIIIKQQTVFFMTLVVPVMILGVIGFFYLAREEKKGIKK